MESGEVDGRWMEVEQGKTRSNQSIRTERNRRVRERGGGRREEGGGRREEGGGRRR